MNRIDNALAHLGRQWWPYAIGLTLLVVMWGVQIARHSPDNVLSYPDTKQYWGIASSLLERGQYAYYEPETRMRQPLYPLFLVLVRGITGNSLLAVQTAQLALVIAGVIAMALLARDACGPAAALIAVMLAIVWPLWVQQAMLVVTESLFMALFLWTVYFLYLTIVQGKTRHALVCGVLAGLTTLTRPTGALLVLLAAALIIALSRGRRVRLALIVLFAFGLSVLPWAARNWVAAREFTILSTDGGVTLWDATQTSESLSLAIAPIRDGGIAPLTREGNARYTQMALQNVLADPPGYVGRNAAKVLSLMLGIPYIFYDFGFAPARLLSYLLFGLHLAVLALAAYAVTARWRSQRDWILCLMGAAIGQWVALLPFWATLKHSLPIEPFLFALAAGGVVALLRRGRTVEEPPMSGAQAS